MVFMLKRHGLWVLAWLAATLLGALLLARGELTQQREAFDTNARIVHRLLSQRVVQHDAVLATLALLQTPDPQLQAAQRLPSVYPHILSVQQRERDTAWPTARLQAAEAESRRLKRAVLAGVELAQGRYQVLLAAEPASYLLQIDLPSMVPWAEWPMVPETSPVRVSLRFEGQSIALQAGRPPHADAHGWPFAASKVLAADSQPFDVVVEQHLGWGELPWRWMAAWAAAAAALLLAGRTVLGQRHARRRAEELLRLGQVARLNTLGELAAGMAHELNQPLTAILASTQAASRMLKDEFPDVPLLQQALSQAVEQSRRASDVIGRLRRVVEQPGLGERLVPVALPDVVRQALYLLEPEMQSRQVTPMLETSGPPIHVLADPVALAQIVHNLLMNALQALDKVPARERGLTLHLSSTATQGLLTVQDRGPGIAASALPRLFEPFFSTREGGLGLGLSLCETLTTGMGGTLTAANRVPRGAEFCLRLPLKTEPEVIA
jgi:signal transduction histidine kinase